MITLHRKESDEASRELGNELDELVIAYKTETHSQDESGLPFIEEDGKVYKDESEIRDWLQTLKDELSWQRSLSGDGCYIDPNKGEVC